MTDDLAGRKFVESRTTTETLPTLTYPIHKLNEAYQAAMRENARLREALDELIASDDEHTAVCVNGTTGGLQHADHNLQTAWAKARAALREPKAIRDLAEAAK